MQHKKKRQKAIIASGLLSLAILLTGTYAWRSISQRATNETRKEVETGGRLHDDFDGENKDVYVENYSSKENGTPIFVRVRLSEYLESGIDAGINLSDSNRQAVSLDPNATIDNKASWSIHVPNSTNLAQCTGVYPFHDYWTWQLGGSTVYMPTFNKNNDSLDADINGTWTYVDQSGNNVPYGDYKTYEVGDPVTADAQYSKNSSVGTPDPTGTYKTANETHTAKETQTATVMTMQQWLASGAVPGKYWIWDEDGWAYWGEALQPEEATGCLLTGIKATSNASENTYYAIDVVGEFASAFEWGKPEDTQAGTSAEGFYINGLTTDGKYLLDRIAGVVSDDNANQYVSCGHNTYKQILSNGTLGSLICAGEDQKIGTADDKTNVIDLDNDLEIDGTNYGKLFIGPGTNNTYWAMGNDNLLGTGDDVKIWYQGTGKFPGEPFDESKISFVGADEIVITGTPDGMEVEPNQTLNLSANVKLNGSPISNQGVVWSLSDSKNSTIDSATGELKVSEKEMAGTVLTVTVKSDEDGKNAIKTIKLTVVGPDEVSITSGGITIEKDQELTQRSGQTFEATVKCKGTEYSINKVKWELSGNEDSETKLENGVLTIGSAEKKDTILTIKAIAVSDSSVFGQITVKVPSIFKNVVGTTTTIKIDGVEFYALAKNGDETLIFAKEPIGKCQFGTSMQWNESCTVYKELTAWLEKQPTLNRYAKKTTIYTRKTISGYDVNNYDSMSCKVFALSEADLFGTANGQSTNITEANKKYEYTYAEKQLTTNTSIIGFTEQKYGQYFWLRSPRNYTAGDIAIGTTSGTSEDDFVTGIQALRPALWVEGL